MPQTFRLKSGQHAEISHTDMDLYNPTKIPLKLHTYGKQSKLYTSNKFYKSVLYIARQRKLKK